MKIAVKELAKFIASSGDLSYDTFFNHDENEGQKAHQYLQKNFPKDSESEVYIKRIEKLDKYEIEITGFIDGVHNHHTLEEIKSTKADLDLINLDSYPAHLAQLKLYGAMYLLNHHLEEVRGILTYINLNTYQVKQFTIELSKNELIAFYEQSLQTYLEWQLFLLNDFQTKQKSLKALRFPFASYRFGQQAFMKAVFYSLRAKQILYGVAPTGVGKTISTLYPALKNLQKPKDKIFYLTAKTTQKKLAIDTTNIMIKNGLDIRLLELTSKEKSCFLKQEICDPDNCSFAKDFFGKLKEAIKDILHEKLITKDVVADYALKYGLCPFEFSLNVSEYVDLVIADYNYVFDPQVRLIRYFEEDNDYQIAVLIDEAHNLVDRARGMYSEELLLSDLLKMKRAFKGLKPSLNTYIKKIMIAVDELMNETTDDHRILNDIPKVFLDNLETIITRCQSIFEDTPKDKFKNRNEAMKLYLQVKSFMKINDYYSEAHRFVIQKVADDYYLKICCLNSAKFTHEIMQKLNGTILFSATLTPLDYFKELLSEKAGEHIILPSPFPDQNLKLVFMDKIDTYYQNRNESVDDIIEAIDIMVNSKKGNYIVFFPSYQYLHLVLEHIQERTVNYRIIEQAKNMAEFEREEIINLFDDSNEAKVGFFVVGGMFSEGIDFVGDKLSGVLIVGVAIPQVNYYNEMLKKYFDEKFALGFEYAYTYPGFNKVLQAAGRVIRTQDDQGIVVIADKRITNYRYLSMLPSHWHHYKRINKMYHFKDELERFWQKK